MNIDYLYQRIKQPYSAQTSDIPMLKELTDKYPYCQIFPILYLNTLALHKNLHFEDELKKYAYCINDREKLHDLIYSTKLIENKEKIPELNSSENIHPDPIVIEFELEKIKKEETDKLSDKLDSNTIKSKNLEVSNKEEDFVKEIKKEIFEQNPNPKEDELEKEILSHVIASSYSLEMEDRFNIEEKETNENTYITIEKPEKFDIHTKRTFTSWLKASENKPLEENKATPKNDIIEKFIQNEPQLSKPKTEFYSAPKKAKESLNEDNLLYTETLANIFALQGNYPKAIKAFKQLMLTIPEKNLYFAQKIEELNKKINS